MPKLKLQVQMTVDGRIAGPHGEMDFMTWDWDDELKAYVEELTESVDTIILGRKLAEGFIPYWAGVAANPEEPEQASGKRFTEMPKVVFSRTLDQSNWPNAVVASDLTGEVTRLKQAGGKDLITYGGAELVSSLLRHRLIDELHLFINPVAIGEGKTIFDRLEGSQALKLVQSKGFPCGIALQHYAVVRE